MSGDKLKRKPLNLEALSSEETDRPGNIPREAIRDGCLGELRRLHDRRDPAEARKDLAI